VTDRICLITAPLATDFEDPDLILSRDERGETQAPKLGVLALASVLENAGLHPVVFDCDRAYAEFTRQGGDRGREEFPAWVAPQILATGARLFGFSSICSSYPITIRMAEYLKRCDSGCTTLLGGPQASVTALPTLDAFPFVDYVLRGEADLTLPVFVEQWSGARRFAEVPGLTWRSPFGPQKNADAPVIDDLDSLPLPAYHLSDRLKDSAYAFLELGRGCPFACTFCSTNDFFRRKFRVKSPARVLTDMRLVAATYGFSCFNLVHDMFTVDRRKVVAFCEAMIEAQERFTWTCSARTDCVDDPLLELMARAGCIGIFYGVETGSMRMQRIIDKDLDPVQARAAIETTSRLGIAATVSTIIGFPEETEDDLRATLDTFMHAVRQPYAIPKLNILAPLAGTPVQAQYEDQLVLEELASNLAYTGRSQSASDRELVRRHRAIFPNFYMLPTAAMDRASLQELGEFLPAAAVMLRWVTVAVYQRSSDILGFFRAWLQHRKATHPEMQGSGIRQYYRSDFFRRELLAYIREHMAEFGDAAVEAMVAYEDGRALAAREAPPRPDAEPVTGVAAASDIPVRAPGVHVLELRHDIQNVLDSLNGVAALQATGEKKHYRTEPCGFEEVRLIEITKKVAGSLRLCDGTRTVGEFAEGAGRLFGWPETLWSYAAERLLERLRSEGMVEIYRPHAGVAAAAD
jgi:radical SAM superfamily enzyme YgiQ (UPF0313 family)